MYIGATCPTPSIRKGRAPRIVKRTLEPHLFQVEVVFDAMHRLVPNDALVAQLEHGASLDPQHLALQPAQVMHGVGAFRERRAVARPSVEV